KVKIKSDDVSVFTPKQMEKILHAAPPHLIPILAVGAFAGIRMAELNRLDWSAFDLEREFIELRADGAKTASRRLVPITDNLRAWIEPLPRKGKVVRHAALHREVTSLARALKMEWPRNVLRHSFISYRIATVKSADQVTLEAGNSPSVIFKNYRELTTEDEADKWFGILLSTVVGRLFPPPLPRHRLHRHDSHGQTHDQRGDPQVPFDLFLERRDHANHRRGDANDGLGNVVEVDGRAHGFRRLQALRKWRCRDH
ncbi:MAG: hypothetical protein WED15_01395, partial [Akkermansiaceae bacterium]